MKRHICVFCGSRSGADPRYHEAAQALGTSLARQGWTLVYGGGRAGLMGVLADAALAAQGEVIGVMPHALAEREWAHQGLTELRLVDSMHARKQGMAEAADAFMALPGGLGTLEELFEVWTWQQLRLHNKPVGLLNTAGYFDALLSFLDAGVSQGFIYPEQRALLHVAAQADDLLSTLNHHINAEPSHYEQS